MASLKASFAATRGSPWNLFLVWLLNLGIEILGLLALIVGLFAAIPVVFLTMAYIYRRLADRMQHESSNSLISG